MQAKNLKFLQLFPRTLVTVRHRKKKLIIFSALAKIATNPKMMIFKMISKKKSI
jgi:hypothetical protein